MFVTQNTDTEEKHTEVEVTILFQWSFYQILYCFTYSMGLLKAEVCE